MVRHQADHEVETQVTETSETMKVTDEFAALVPDLLRFGRGRYRTVEFLVHNPSHTFRLSSHDVQDIIIGREDENYNFVPTIDLTAFGGVIFGVSRRHATLNNLNGTLFITDHNTTNGTYVNGKRIQPEIPHAITNGDQLSVGKVRLNVHFTDRVLST